MLGTTTCSPVSEMSDWKSRVPEEHTPPALGIQAQIARTRGSERAEFRQGVALTTCVVLYDVSRLARGGTAFFVFTPAGSRSAASGCRRRARPVAGFLLPTNGLSFLHLFSKRAAGSPPTRFCGSYRRSCSRRRVRHRHPCPSGHRRDRPRT